MKNLPKVHPLLRLTLFGALYVCGSLGMQTPIVLLYMAVNRTVGVPETAGADLLAGRMPAGLLLALAWLGLLFGLALTAGFHAWAREDPLTGLRLKSPRIRAGPAGLGRDLALGLAFGLASMAVIAGLYWMLGWAAFSLQAGAGWLVTLALFAAALAPAAASEEIIFRGYVQETLEGWRGPVVGIVVSSILFSLAHAANPNVTGLSLLNIALAGAAFSLAYRVTGRLWLPIAYHFMWNFAQGPLFGLPVSGMNFGALTTASITGPALLTGGAFGPEGGLVATVVLVVSIVGLWAWGQA